MVEATWEPFSALVLPEKRVNSVLVDYVSLNKVGELLRLTETIVLLRKPKDRTLLVAGKICMSVLCLET